MAGIETETMQIVDATQLIDNYINIMEQIIIKPSNAILTKNTKIGRLKNKIWGSQLKWFIVEEQKEVLNQNKNDVSQLVMMGYIKEKLLGVFIQKPIEPLEAEQIRNMENSNLFKCEHEYIKKIYYLLYLYLIKVVGENINENTYIENNDQKLCEAYCLDICNILNENPKRFMLIGTIKPNIGSKHYSPLAYKHTIWNVISMKQAIKVSKQLKEQKERQKIKMTEQYSVGYKI